MAWEHERKRFRQKRTTKGLSPLPNSDVGKPVRTEGSRALIAEFALPMIFKSLNNLRLTGQVEFGGWAFRGPLTVPCSWDV